MHSYIHPCMENLLLACIYLYIIVSLYMHVHAFVECVYLCVHILVLTHADVLPVYIYTQIYYKNLPYAFTQTR